MRLEYLKAALLELRTYLNLMEERLMEALELLLYRLENWPCSTASDLKYHLRLNYFQMLVEVLNKLFQLLIMFA